MRSDNCRFCAVEVIHGRDPKSEDPSGYVPLQVLPLWMYDPATGIAEPAPDQIERLEGLVVLVDHRAVCEVLVRAGVGRETKAPDQAPASVEAPPEDSKPLRAEDAGATFCCGCPEDRHAPADWGDPKRPCLDCDCKKLEVTV